MGTRADFYVGRGEKAEWLGSIAWDGYPDGIDKPVLKAKDEAKYRKLVQDFLGSRDDCTKPEDGWPWPWEDSRTTDYAYAFDGGKVHGSCFGSKWFDPLTEREDDEERGPKMVFPNMVALKKVARGKRSGTIMISNGPNGLEVE